MAEGANKQIFTIVATRNASAIRDAIKELGVQFIPIKEDSWILVYAGTTKELGDRLGIRGGETGSAMIFAVNNYSGRASADIWEWLKVNWPQNV